MEFYEKLKEVDKKLEILETTKEVEAVEGSDVPYWYMDT